jgi:asparagine synthase (glutamine-hydrolysing)
LPESVFNRRKMGFTVPLPEWFRGGLRERAEATFFGEPGGRSGILDGSGLRRMWYEHQLGVRNHATSLWSILMFEGWVRRFLDRASPSSEARGSIRGAKPTVIEA